MGARDGELWTVTLPGQGVAKVSGAGPTTESGQARRARAPSRAPPLTAEGGPNGRAGMAVRVLEETFQGSVVRYLVEGPDASKLAVVTPLDRRLPEGSSQRQAWISWDERWSYLLPA